MKRELYSQMLNFTDLSCYFILLSLINTYNDSDFPIRTPLNEYILTHRAGTKKGKFRAVSAEVSNHSISLSFSLAKQRKIKNS